MNAFLKSRSLEIRSLEAFYSEDPQNLIRFLDDLRTRLEDNPDPAIWISRTPWESILERAHELRKSWLPGSGMLARLPLFGIPFAVKDNIDVIGMETTAACPAFAYRAKATSLAVARLEAAGAIVIGKANLDQFATGLVGMRSPYGTVGNPFHPDHISGGSSSGSAVAVAAGLVSFAMGTDTAGSGRIPAGFNNIVGLKPTRGLVSTRGVVAACRSLDCPSIFALTCEDASRVLKVCQGEDAEDPFSRKAPEATAALSTYRSVRPTTFRFGVPDSAHLDFFGDEEAAALFEQAQARLQAMGGIPVEIPFAPFAEAALLLYRGPWLAERQAAFGDFVDAHPGEVLPVIREIMAPAKSLSAVEGFRAYYRLRDLRKKAVSLFTGMDFLLVPTSPSHPTRHEVEADPISMNSRLGLYTNFVNLMDLCALAVPSGRKSNGLPFGVTFIATAFRDGLLASMGAVFHAATGLGLGVTGNPVPAAVASPATKATDAIEAPGAREWVRLAVAGLHMSGQPLNGQLLDLGARFSGSRKTAAVYRAYAVERNGRVFPGLVRQTSGGGAVDVEVWELTRSALGAFMDNVKEPLCIGTVELEAGEKVKGFLCEASAIPGAREFTDLGSWRAFLASRK